MKKLNFVRSVASWGYWICAIGKVFAGIVAVLCLLGVVLLVSVPRDFVQVKVSSALTVDVDLRSILGEEWENSKDEIVASIGEGLEETENGVRFTEEGMESAIGVRAAALQLIPSLVQYSLLAALLFFVSGVFREIKDSPVPFTPAAANNIRTVGSLTMALGAAPGIASGLIGLLTTSEMDSVDIDLSVIFLGFVLWALAEIFRYGVSLQCGGTVENDSDGVHPDAF